ncbi:MAG TPA: extracellular solute-binding protein, partial [Lachnospiraceae bacterium]|nr:extracellular solute-binding protein [Lachnospiraceae bacterium]
MKKKLLSVILAVSMTAALLAGCGSSEEAAPAADQPAADEATEETAQEPADEATEEVAESTDTTDSTEATGEDPQLEKTIKILSIWAEDNDNGVLINEICNAYKEVNPNFNFEYEYVSSDDLKQKVATLAASNDLPDLFVYESGKPILDLVDADQIMDVGEILDEYGCADKLSPSAVSLLKTLSGTEQLYDLPLGLNVEGFWYNKALFEQAGVEVPTTWDEFEDVLKTLNDAGIQPLSCGAADKWGATRIMNAYLVRTAGADAMAKAADGEASYTDAAYVAAAQKLQDWANEGYFGKGVTTVDMNTAGTMLMTGEAAIFYNGSWFTQNLTDTTANLAGEDGIGFFNVPVVDASISDAESYSMNCGNILCVGKEKYDEATGWFLKYFVENIGNVAMEEQGTVKGYTYDVEPKNNSGYTQLVLDEIDKATSAFTWYEATMGSEVSTVAQENVQTLLNGDMTAEEYMQSI